VPHWSPASHWAPAEHALSLNDSAPALPLGPHFATHVAPAAWQRLAQPVRNAMLQSVRNGPGARHAPVVHVCVPPHVTHAAPPAPHEVVVVPARHELPLQQPEHDVVSHTQVPAEQRWPVLHAPVVQVPPQPSLAPHALPLQLGVHPVQRPPEHPPLPLHDAQMAPPLPHALDDVPPRQVLPLQQPAHDVGSQTHAPPSQCWPPPHVPVTQVPPQPSLAPQALPLHEGVHVPLPHTLGPPPPQLRPAGHAPQSRIFPQRPTIPLPQ
jgi:hypothetical protein